MFIIEKFIHEKVASTTSTSRQECENLMQRIYDENPSYWPHGLSIAAHDGGVYMIREASTKQPVGFTGWQEREENGLHVGYYTIGVLPEYRNNGYAKQAVSALIQLKAATVDKVQALIAPHNKPSLALADALHIPVIKSAAIKPLLGALIGAVGMDSQTYGRDKSMSDYANTPFTTSRITNGLFNAALGAAAGNHGLASPKGLAAIASMPAKDVALAAIPAVPSITSSLKVLADKPQTTGNFVDAMTPGQRLLAAALGGAGMLGAGYMGMKGVGALKSLSKAQEAAAGGRIRVALPTKDPGDNETVIELPMGDLDMSSTTQGKLQRDLRRRVRKETKERTVHRTLDQLMPPKEASNKYTSIFTIEHLLNTIHA